MTNASLETRLLAAIHPHDLLTHPFYRAWSMGTLSLGDLRAYAGQYLHQVEALPGLLRAARDGSADRETRAALQRNLDEEEGRSGEAHRALWLRFAAAIDAGSAAPHDETLASARRLRALAEEGEVAALASLWAYETQTARVAATKRIGLAERYGVTRGLAFFELHEQLDVHHAADLLAGLERACAGDEARREQACAAASRSAQAQWHFLDGAEVRRSSAMALS